MQNVVVSIYEDEDEETKNKKFQNVQVFCALHQSQRVRHEGIKYNNLYFHAFIALRCYKNTLHFIYYDTCMCVYANNSGI